MKILLVNYRYFLSGGPERYMFNVTKELEKRGHEVIPFSINYAFNVPTSYAKYFVPPLGASDEVTFRDQRMTIKSVSRTFRRLLYASDVERALVRLIEDTKPDIAYVLHYLRKLSPSVLVAIKQSRIPVVVRLSDYAMICPQAHCMRDGRPCEDCCTGSLWPSIRYGCVQRSYGISLLNACATWYHRFKKYFDLIDVFVTTNQFMYQMMEKSGYRKDKLRCVPTFTNTIDFYPANGQKDDNIFYAGRLEPIKGIDVLIHALTVLKQRRSDLEFSLNIAGSGDESFVSKLKSYINKFNLNNSINFLGVLSTQELSERMRSSLLSVVPSVIYENLPNVILESYACGTPVVASDIGSLSSMVEEGVTGFLFRRGDTSSLAERLVYCLTHKMELRAMGPRCRQVAETVYSSAVHLDTLENLFHELIRTD